MHDNQADEVAAAEAVLARTEQLRRAARRDTKGLAVPLLVLGGVGLFLLATGGLPFSPLAVMVGMAGFMAPTALIGIALLLIAWRRRDKSLAVWTVGFGVVVTLAHLGFFTNRLGDLLRVTGLADSVDVHVVVQADLVVLDVLGLVLIGAAVRGRRARTATRRVDEPVRS